jgi:hypothetical protein
MLDRDKLNKNQKQRKELNDFLKPTKLIKQLDQDMDKYIDPKKVLKLNTKEFNILFSNNKKYNIGLPKRFLKKE